MLDKKSLISGIALSFILLVPNGYSFQLQNFFLFSVAAPASLRRRLALLEKEQYQSRKLIHSADGGIAVFKIDRFVIDHLQMSP